MSQLPRRIIRIASSKSLTFKLPSGNKDILYPYLCRIPSDTIDPHWTAKSSKFNFVKREYFGASSCVEKIVTNIEKIDKVNIDNESLDLIKNMTIMNSKPCYSIKVGEVWTYTPENVKLVCVYNQFMEKENNIESITQDKFHVLVPSNMGNKNDIYDGLWGLITAIGTISIWS